MQAKTALNELARRLETNPAATVFSLAETVNRQDFPDCVHTTMSVRAHDVSALAAANFYRGTNFKPVFCPEC